MKKINEIVSLLADSLCDFGQSESSRMVIAKAIEANDWFTEQDIASAVGAIYEEMLEAQKFERWLGTYPTLPLAESRRVAIIMAGNIPLVGFFDLLCTLAAGHQAWVKPSSKDRVLMEYIISLLVQIEPSIPIYIYDDLQEYDAVIATGGHAAGKYFQTRFGDIKHLHRGSRHSIAVLAGNESQEQMQLLAEDIYSYSGLGCRNVAMIIAPRGAKIEIPPYPTTQKYRNSYLQNRALAAISGARVEDNGSLIMLPCAEFTQSLSTLSVWRYDTLQEVEEWIERHEGELQCIVSQIIKHPQQVDFGQAQHPTLYDYADGVNTMKFLEFKD
ncbi:MAG: acyl-CoA reductase [Rikenellaceae bacterium]